MTMVKTTLIGAAVAAGALMLASPTFGHGGTYRGPGDTVPPPGGGNSGGAAPPPPVTGGAPPATPGATPSSPGSPAPVSTPGSAPNTPGQPAPASSPNTDLGADVSIWDFWWGFNKEPYLNLRNAVRRQGVQSGSDTFYLGAGTQNKTAKSLRPTPQQIQDLVVPALKNALETEEQNDIVTGALIALAKIGDENNADGTSEFVNIISGFLPAAEQEISETAALALGILADDRSVPTLVALMTDSAAGQKLVEKSVPFRTRTFAAYGLGLVGNKTPTNEMRQSIGEHLIDFLQGPSGALPDIKVGAMQGLGLIPFDWDSDPAVEEKDSNAHHVANRVAVLEYLHMKMHMKDRGPKGAFDDRRVRAQTPIAAARLLSAGDLPDTEAALEIRKKIVERLIELAKDKKDDVAVRQSATIALGMVADASDDEAGVNKEILKELDYIGKKAADNQTEYFAVMAIAQMGSRKGAGDEPFALQDDCADYLQKAMKNGKGQKAPWAAIALGVFGNALIENDGILDPSIRDALRLKFSRSKSTVDKGAYAIALGLIEDTESASLLLKELEAAGTGKDDVRGYICVGLGLMDAGIAKEKLNEVVKASKFRPDLLKQAAIGLGLLGDKEAVAVLLEMFESAKGLSSQAAIASALGTIGDNTAVEGLVKMVRGETEKSMTDVARGFACAALGITCDKEDLPWNTKIAVNTNYRANVSTLTSPDTGDGILDIL